MTKRQRPDVKARWIKYRYLESKQGLLEQLAHAKQMLEVETDHNCRVGWMARIAEYQTKLDKILKKEDADSINMAQIVYDRREKYGFKNLQIGDKLRIREKGDWHNAMAAAHKHGFKYGCVFSCKWDRVAGFGVIERIDPSPISDGKTFFSDSGNGVVS